MKLDQLIKLHSPFIPNGWRRLRDELYLDNTKNCQMFKPWPPYSQFMLDYESRDTVIRKLHCWCFTRLLYNISITSDRAHGVRLSIFEASCKSLLDWSYHSLNSLFTVGDNSASSGMVNSADRMLPLMKASRRGTQWSNSHYQMRAPIAHGLQYKLFSSGSKRDFSTCKISSTTACRTEV